MEGYDALLLTVPDVTDGGTALDDITRLYRAGLDRTLDVANWQVDEHFRFPNRPTEILVPRPGPDERFLAELARRDAERQRPRGERDQARRQDLATLREAMERLRGERGRYPCTGDNVWRWSVDGPDWLRDDPTGCDGGEPIAVERPPTDPLNLADKPWVGGSAYGYRSWRAGCPPELQGHGFIVVAHLEMPDLGRPPIKDCDGSAIPWPPDVLAVTSVTP